MKLFLTSNIGGSYIENGKRIPCALDNSNHLLDILSKHWPEDAKCLIISSDPVLVKHIGSKTGQSLKYVRMSSVYSFHNKSICF